MTPRGSFFALATQPKPPMICVRSLPVRVMVTRCQAVDSLSTGVFTAGLSESPYRPVIPPTRNWTRSAPVVPRTQKVSRPARLRS